jgi:hypothetical protein
METLALMPAHLKEQKGRSFIEFYAFLALYALTGICNLQILNGVEKFDSRHVHQIICNE